MWETQGHKVLHFGHGKHSTLFKMVMNWGLFIVEFTILPYKLGYHSNDYGNYIIILYIYIYHSYIIIYNWNCTATRMASNPENVYSDLMRGAPAHYRYPPVI